ncbi:MAG: RNA methyltransferase [Clostridiales bacterium]|nr:MAG: RNA methyltransferase [Clostridiales bacterium]
MRPTKTADIAENLAKKYGACTTLVSESVMKVLADTVSPSGILAVIGIPLSKPEGVNAVVLDGVQDSGNVGTIIRTAVGAGFSDIYLVDSADAFSPKTVRAKYGRGSSRKRNKSARGRT